MREKERETEMYEIVWSRLKHRWDDPMAYVVPSLMAKLSF